MTRTSNQPSRTEDVTVIVEDAQGRKAAGRVVRGIWDRPARMRTEFVWASDRFPVRDLCSNCQSELRINLA